MIQFESYEFIINSKALRTLKDLKDIQVHCMDLTKCDFN